MSIKRLSIKNLRNIQQVDFEAHPQLNLFYGANGAGKTSILEAINLAGLGRSFRHHRPKPLISYQCDELTVFAQVGAVQEGTTRLGVSKSSRGETHIRIGGQTVYSAAQLAEVLPLLCLNAHSFELITGPPKPRRQLLDWLTFHVEPLFLSTWKDLQHCLKQRNSLLRRDKIRDFELDSWDRQLTDLTAKIHFYRSNAFELYVKALDDLGRFLPDVDTITISYKNGWPLDQKYSDVLALQRPSDSQRGYTQSGPHRADLGIKVGDHNAAESLSRGQSKIVISALTIALAQAYKSHTGQACTLLVDDLPSELDYQHRQRVGEWLSKLGSQLFVTAVEKEPLIEMWPPGFSKAAKLFHVKQGQVETQ
jgi:DNA replication and repair protein RecF